MKKLLIDCGGNLGDGFLILDGLVKPDNVIIFEPNLNCFNILIDKFKTNKFNILNKAVGNSNKLVKFHIPKKDNLSVGSTIHDDFHNSKENIEYNTIDCEMVDLSQYISEIEDCEIYLKLDVEGSEYDILEKMILDKTIFKIKKLFVEFHENYVTDEFIKKYDLINRKNDILLFLEKNKIEYKIWH